MMVLIPLISLSLAVATAAGPPPRVSLSAGYKVDPAWPQKPADYRWFKMCSVAVDGQDRVWTLNQVDPFVQVYAADGKFLFAWGGADLKQPHHVHIDYEGSVWIADIGLHVVRK